MFWDQISRFVTSGKRLCGTRQEHVRSFFERTSISSTYADVEAALEVEVKKMFGVGVDPYQGGG